MQLIFYWGNTAALDDMKKRFKATHLIVQQLKSIEVPPLRLPPGLELIYSNPEISVYKIGEQGG